MKYSLEVDINLPREKVIELFNDQDNLGKWQCGLESFEHISGEAGEVGAKSLIKYNMNKRKIEMTETIIKKDLPNEYWFTFEAKGMWNQVDNYFIVVDKNTTKWKIDNEFKGKGILAIMLFLMPGMFKKQSLKFMNNFKAFAEGRLEDIIA